MTLRIRWMAGGSARKVDITADLAKMELLGSTLTFRTADGLVLAFPERHLLDVQEVTE